MTSQFQPTEEEARLILELERGINRELGDEGYYDVMDEFDLEEDPTLPTISLPTLITRPTRPITLLTPRTTAPTDFPPWTRPPSDFTRPPTDFVHPRAVDQGQGGPLFGLHEAPI